MDEAASTEIYTLSLHDALPILAPDEAPARAAPLGRELAGVLLEWSDRKSTRLNSSHSSISYAVFCLKKKMRYDLDSTGRTLNQLPFEQVPTHAKIRASPTTIQL